MAADEKFTSERILEIETWVPGKLFSIKTTRPSNFRFIAGQFARLGVMRTTPEGNAIT